MATESNSPGFRHSSFAMSRHAISFQPTAKMSNISELVPMVGSNYYGVNSVDSAAMVFSAGAGNFALTNQSTDFTQSIAGGGNCSVSVSGTSSGSGSGSPLMDSVPGLKHDTGFAAEWSVDEQYNLEEGLKKFADEPSITRYIKIAAALQNKTVRDVALRCRWMTRKKRKFEEHLPGKKVSSKKDKLLEFSKSTSTLPHTFTGYSQLIQCTDQKHLVSFEVSGLEGKVKHLLEQNTQAFSRITANLHSCKLQDNIDLLFQARNNITAVLNNMNETPGIMSQMPALPVTLDEDLAKTILPIPNQTLVFGSCNGMFLKEEPRC